MSKFSDKFVDGMSLVAEKVDENKFLGAIKDSFTIYMPFVIVGSFMNLFNTILCSTTTGLAKWVPALEALKPIFTAANFATLSCMTLPIVFLIGLKLGKKNNVPEHISAIMALASYLTICPQIVSVVVDDKTGQWPARCSIGFSGSVRGYADRHSGKPAVRLPDDLR